MKKILAAVAVLGIAVATLAYAQTSIRTVAGVFSDSTGTLVGSKNYLTGKEELFTALVSGVVLPAAGGTGVANNNAATFTRAGNHALTLTTTGATGLTLPTSGTLAVLGANTFTGAQTAPSFVPNSATVPANGMYLGAANSLAFATDTTHRWTINASGAFNCATDGGCDIGNGSADPRDISIKRNLTLRTATTVASNAACTAGTIYWDASYLYVCTATGVVKRAALTGGY